MTESFFRQSAGYGPVGTVDDYETRQIVEVDGDSPEIAAERVWEIYQNVDDNWHTPDGGRSMMVGDLVMLLDENKNLSVWRAERIGFKRVSFTPRASDG